MSCKYRIAYYLDGLSHTVYAGESLNKSHNDWMREWQDNIERVLKWVKQLNAWHPDRHYFVERDLVRFSSDVVFDVPGFVKIDRGCKVAVNVRVFSSYPSEPGWYAKYIKKDSEEEVYVGPFKTNISAISSGEDNAEFKEVICVTTEQGGNHKALRF